MPSPLERMHAPTRAWFSASFAGPTAAQLGAWSAINAGESALVSAPTGSGKTLAAFLAGIDRLLFAPATGDRSVRLLYVSPLKALAYDVDRNLRAPLVGITYAAERAGEQTWPVEVGMRTGDTTADERRRLVRHPPDILITTPESLFLLLTSQAREILAGVETVIVDEVHAVAGTKRGAHLALTLERLEHLRVAREHRAPLQRIGLSATQRPLDEVARFLGGGTVDGERWTPRPVRTVQAPAHRPLDVEIIVPVEDMGRLGEIVDEPMTGPAAGGGETRRSIWPAVHPRILELIRAHRSTIVFANSRRLAERLCARLNDLAAEDDPDAEPIARAHHGSVAREQRLGIEEALKSGKLRCVVATSSLELGIDMGTVDLVVQVESPKSVASGLQRIGRAGHHVGGTSIGKIFPKYRGDLVECAVVTRRMLGGEIEYTRYPRNPLDVLAQQVVAVAAMDTWDVADLHACIRGAANFAEVSRGQLDGVLDMLSGRYPSDEFAELRPRINWDRVADRIAGRRGAQRLAVTSGGTIPDRGLYGVFIVGEGEGRRVGELDEEMVYETRPGETFTLGSTTWRIEDITRDQVLVTPAPGQPGKLPFWHGDAPGRPIEVGRAVGAFLRELTDTQRAGGDGGVRASAGEPAGGELAALYGLDQLAAQNLSAYVGEQLEATGVAPSDRTLVVERFRDEIGDWRICLLSPFGGRVHAPWALAIETRLRERFGVPVQTMHADDGIVVRIPDGTDADIAMRDLLVLDPDEVEDLVVTELANSALFAARFRECAARALLLPRRRPGGRTPLWQQRQRAADLLAVASRYGQFPILLETYRECLRDVFDVPALVEVLRDIASRRVRIVEVETPMASPFASSLLFNYIATYMYEGDAPLAERRAAALSLDRELLAELVGSDELRELVDADALAELELELQRLTPERGARDADGVHDLLRELGDLRTDEVVARVSGAGERTVTGWLSELERARRIWQTPLVGERRWVAAEDAGRLRDGLGVPPPGGLPVAFLEPVRRPLIDLVARYARTHGPFHAGDVATRLGLPVDAVELALAELEREDRVTRGEFRPGGVRREWCATDVLRKLRRRSLASLRREVEPVEPEALARFLPAWQGVGARAFGVERTLEVVEHLQGAPLPASVLETDVVAARIRDYRSAWLDELTASGEIVWVGRGPLGSDDGKLSLYLREQAPLLVPSAPATLDALDEELRGPRHAALLQHLMQRGASFWPQLYAAVGGGDETETVEALWDLVWAGVVTNDSLQPLRALRGSSRQRSSGSSRRRRRPGRVAARTGPARAAGRWSLVAELTTPRPSDTERATALAAQLLDRYGVVTRDAVMAEDVPGGFSAVYGVLRAMEESGRTRRGYFVEGLGGAQFAVPGAVDRLRAVRTSQVAGEDAGVRVLAATDPANPFGAALGWPDTLHEGRHLPKRVAGAHVVIADGRLLAFLERGGRSLLTFTDDPDALALVAQGLGVLVDERRVERLQLQRIDGDVPLDQAVVEHLRAADFVDNPRGLIRRHAATARRSS